MGTVIVFVDGKPQTIPLPFDQQSFALVEANPCLEHTISLQAPFGTEETALTKYNSKSDLSLYSGLLQMFVKTKVCLKKDNSTVNIPEPFEDLRLCIITRGEQKLKKTETATSLSANLKIVNPQSNSGTREPKSIVITIPVDMKGIRRCNDSDFQSNNSNDRNVNLAAAIAIPMITVALIFVALIVAIVVYRNRKESRTEVIKVDENPTYGVYEENENGEMRQNSIEVIDTSPD